MIHNENISSNDFSNYSSSSTNFTKNNKYKYARTNQFQNKGKYNLFKNQRSISRELSSPLYDFSNYPTKKLKFAAHKEYKNTNGKNKNNTNELHKKYDLILKSRKDYKKEAIMKLFSIEKKELNNEINYFLQNPSFIYDTEHEKDNNSNYPYINENFIDILLLSYRNKLILNSTIKPMKIIQTDITFQKRNILLSWLTELNMKYIKDQNILFLSVKYLDRILYKQKIDINEFQLIGILCFNLALKLDNSYSVFKLEEIISLTGDGTINDIKEENKLIKKIRQIEMKICDILNFNFIESTCIIILHRLIQIINIQNKEIEKIFLSIAYFFLEISLYDEQFYTFDEFVKALSCVILTKSLLQEFNIKLGFHHFLKDRAQNYNNEIKNYHTLCQKTIKDLKHLKYGQILFSKYQTKNFQCVINNYLFEFVNNCLK